MADHFKTQVANGLIHTGSGFLMGILASASAGAPEVVLWDNTDSSGTRVFDCFVSPYGFLHIFFPEKFAIYFENGLYLGVGDNTAVALWWRSL
jgi:hypothetical protein